MLSAHTSTARAITPLYQLEQDALEACRNDNPDALEKTFNSIRFLGTQFYHDTISSAWTLSCQLWSLRCVRFLVHYHSGAVSSRNIIEILSPTVQLRGKNMDLIPLPKDFIETIDRLLSAFPIEYISLITRQSIVDRAYSLGYDALTEHIKMRMWM
jgi:hypothetical protein